MSEYKQVPASDEAWESGALGSDPGFAKIAEDEIQSRIGEALAMQPISIRLPKSLIETFKLLGEWHGLGYQPLMRRVLTRFAEAEMKLVLNEFIAEQHRVAEEVEQEDDAPRAASG